MGGGACHPISYSSSVHVDTGYIDWSGRGVRLESFQSDKEDEGLSNTMSPSMFSKILDHPEKSGRCIQL